MKSNQIDLKSLMKLKIVQAGDPILRQQARALTKEEIGSEEIQRIIKIMINTLKDAPGVGLAASQVGLPLQIVVIEDRPEFTKAIPEEELKKRERKPVPLHVLINPRITYVSSEHAHFFEGCLSVDRFIGIVPRALEVRVEAMNEWGEPITIEARGWYARILQHEINHLQGILCTDFTLPRSLMVVENYNKYWLGQPIEKIAEDLQINLV